ncbi:hypothetical protein R1flu_021157 [Riccia fluitans]|uniref:Elongator complex protein 6 n=1 Tax=Riccia fluitans TaxID=41844 RepID=A0ABD1ZS82_9MARC
MVEELVDRVCCRGGSVLVIRDCVACKGCFLLQYLLIKLLMETNIRVVMLGLVEPFSHYARIARKQGCSLQSMRDNGRFVFLEQSQLLTLQGNGTDDEANVTSFSDNPLAAVYLKVREAARGNVVVDPAVDGGQKTCIMIDDASVLDIIAGGDHNFVLDFLQYCRALTVKKQRCSVVLLTHQDVYEESPVSSMNLALEYAADTVLTVEPLSTGLAVDVHGQVTILHRTVQMEIQPSQLKAVDEQELYFDPVK